MMGECGFAAWMKGEVEPFLKKHCRDGYLQSRDGLSIHYNRYRLEGAEKCVVISHGFCEFAEKYNEMIYYLLQEGYSVYIPEHRGHGYSNRTAGDPEMVHVKNYEEYVADFVRFVESVVIPREAHRVLFAHSMGGAIGILTLEQHPGLFEAAILSSPMCGMQTGKFPHIAAKLLAGFYCLIGKGKTYASVAGQNGFCEEPDFEGSSCVSKGRYRYVFEKRLTDPHYHTYGGSYAWVYAGIRACERLMKKGALAQIDIPILLFAAGHDHMVDNDALERFVERTKKTELIFLPDAKHEIFHADDKTRKKYYDEIFLFLKGKKEKNDDGSVSGGNSGTFPILFCKDHSEREVF